MVLTDNPENALLTVPCREKVWTRAGPKFGIREGTVLMIKKKLYGIKSSRAAFCEFLAENDMILDSRAEYLTHIFG